MGKFKTHSWSYSHTHTLTFQIGRETPLSIETSEKPPPWERQNLLAIFERFFHRQFFISRFWFCAILGVMERQLLTATESWYNQKYKDKKQTTQKQTLCPNTQTNGLGTLLRQPSYLQMDRQSAGEPGEAELGAAGFELSQVKTSSGGRKTFLQDVICDKAAWLPPPTALSILCNETISCTICCLFIRPLASKWQRRA